MESRGVADFGAFGAPASHMTIIERLQDKSGPMRAVPKSLTLYYMSHCGACKRLAPDFARVVMQLDKSGADITVRTIDLTKSERIPWVRGAPTMEVRDAKNHYYQLPAHVRSTAGIIKFVAEAMNGDLKPQQDPLTATEISGGATELLRKYIEGIMGGARKPRRVKRLKRAKRAKKLKRAKSPRRAKRSKRTKSPRRAKRSKRKSPRRGK